jgi:hypothetical protein
VETISKLTQWSQVSSEADRPSCPITVVGEQATERYKHDQPSAENADAVSGRSGHMIKLWQDPP